MRSKCHPVSGSNRSMRMSAGPSTAGRTARPRRTVVRGGTRSPALPVRAQADAR